MKFDLLTGGQEIKLVMTFDFSGGYLVLLRISLLLSVLAMISFNFKIIK